MAIVAVPGAIAQQGFRARCQETGWGKRVWGSGFRNIGGGTDIGNRATWFLAKGGPVILNATNTINPPAIEMQFNSPGTIDVNFATNEACAVGKSLTPNALPDDKAVTLTFTNPVKGVGTYVSFGSNTKALYDGRNITAQMFVLPDGSANWLAAPFESTAITGFHVGVGVDPTAPFIAAECTKAELIKAIAFDVEISGNPLIDALVIARLFWIP